MSLEENIATIEYIINNQNTKSIGIPDLSSNPYIVSPITLNNQQYYFEYSYNFRSKLVYLSIYLIKNGNKEYVVKNISLIKDIYIDQYIHNSDWNGFLQFVNINNGTDVSYTIKDISEKFNLIYGFIED